MDKHRLQFLNVSDELEHSPASGKGWKIPVTRKHGHGYLVWSSSAVHYTRPQLQKLHQQLYHPSTSKLMNVLKRASPESDTKETKPLLDDIVQACQACQVYSSSPLHFSARTPDEVVFNQELRMDLMFWRTASQSFMLLTLERISRLHHF
jgi:hypothetical protein